MLLLSSCEISEPNAPRRDDTSFIEIERDHLNIVVSLEIENSRTFKDLIHF